MIWKKVISLSRACRTTCTYARHRERWKAY